MYRIFKNSPDITIDQINEFTVANEAKKIFSQLKNKNSEEIISLLKINIISTYNDGTYVFIDLR